jgi:hypothetical protein
MPRAFQLALALVGSLIVATTSHARPAHKQALGDHYGPYLTKKQHDCRMCHVPDAAGAQPDVLAEDKPHNSFGKRLKAVREELRKAGKKGTIAERLEFIASEDSDGDGVSNQLEILTGHFPGDPSDKPTAEELQQAPKLAGEFAKFHTAYAWRPYEVVHRPAVPRPQTGEAFRIRNPIDAFIADEHQARGLTPRPEAPKQVLLRRLYLDLIGLPPTREELHAFLEDASSDAYEKVVDRLLQDPRYGERWGRHWMDVWRYSDWAGWTGGNQIRDSQPHIWRWRDWIVESLNQDKPYERMILEMLAADELTPDDDNALRATGYLVRNYKMLSRETWMQETVDHTFQAFLGTTIGCARCHDHMFDPILQKEYYQVRAVFEPHNVRIDRIPGQPDTKKDGLVRVFDSQLDAKSYLYVRGDDRNPDKSKELSPGVPEALGGRFGAIEAVKLPGSAVRPDRRAFIIEEDIRVSAAAIRRNDDPRRFQEMQNARAAVIQALDPFPLASAARVLAALPTVEAHILAELQTGVGVAKHHALLRTLEVERVEDEGGKGSAEWLKRALDAADAQRRAAFAEAYRGLLTAQQSIRLAPAAKRAKAQQDLAAAEKAFGQAVLTFFQPLTPFYSTRSKVQYPAVSTGRRLAFARWVADTQNPLTARVAINHIWLRHFGQAIVPSVFDFGRNGRWPTHPALLDWLAAEFMEPSENLPTAVGGRRGWSMKHMHRLILTSSTYRMASTSDAKNVELDRDNTYLWRMPTRRLEAELVRDAVFYVAGKLDSTMGGPDIDQNLGLTVPRRSVYFRHAQEKQMEFLKIFDCAAVTECYQRKQSVMPQQALALANSQLVRQHARILARTFATRWPDTKDFTTAVFEQVLTRMPTEAELNECLAFLLQQTERYATEPQHAATDKGDGSAPSSDPALRAREDLVHVLLNHNDFVTIR